MKVWLIMSERRWNRKWLGLEIRLEWSTCWVKGWVRNGKMRGETTVGKIKVNLLWVNNLTEATEWQTRVTYNLLVSAIDSCSTWFLALIICSKVWITLYIVHKHIAIPILALVSIRKHLPRPVYYNLLAYISLDPFYNML